MSPSRVVRQGCRRAWPLLVAGAIVAAPARADVIVVDEAGGGDFTQLPAALAAAVDGDVLLVRSGTYLGWTGLPAPAKSLTLVADSPAAPPALEALSFEDLPAGHTIVVRGFILFLEYGYAVNVENCAGAVVFEDCEIQGATFGPAGYPNSPPGFAGAHVIGSASVTFLRCGITGGKGTNESVGGPWSTWSSGSGGPAAEVIESEAAFHDCLLLGGAGGYGSLYSGANGGPGLSLKGSTALLSGSTVEGGAGGNGCSDLQMPQTCSGGTGIVLDAASNLQSLDASWAGGIPGTGSSGQTGLVGAPFSGPAGQPIVFDGTARSIAVSSPVREQQPGTLELVGVPGDVVMFITSFQADSQSKPGKKGWLALAPTILGPFALGTISDPSGQQTLGFTAPDLVLPSLEGQTFLLQAFFAEPAGAILGSVTSFTLVDSTL